MSIAPRLALLLCGLSACSSLPLAQKGEACVRSSQCSAGLVCIAKECTTNLDAIADQSVVPDFGDDMDAAAQADAAAVTFDAAAPNQGSDAASSSTSNDAAMAVDTGTVPPDPVDDDAGS